jgi:AcrR family transcriptional regulator
MRTLYGCGPSHGVWDNQSVTTTRQTERSRQTDMKVALSAANAVRRDGFDQMALTRVASDAGYSSGVIYARCDDRSELMVLSWQKSFWPELSEILHAGVTAVVNRDIDALNRTIDTWRSRCGESSVPDIGSATEVIIAARRDEVLGEVVHGDINALLASHGAGPGDTGPTRELVLFTVATFIGSALLNSVTSAESELTIDPTFILHLLANRTVHERPAEMSPSESTGFERPRTGDELRDALIDATEYVIARAGVHRATVSRIARRAGVSVGAIYGLYENKETLVLDCVSVLHPPQAMREVIGWSAMQYETFRSSVGANLRTYLSPGQNLWRMFRIESLVAARHTPALAQLLEDFGHDYVESLLGRMPIEIIPSVPARGTMVGISVLATVDPTIQSLDWQWIPIG